MWQYTNWIERENLELLKIPGFITVLNFTVIVLWRTHLLVWELFRILFKITTPEQIKQAYNGVPCDFVYSET